MRREYSDFCAEISRRKDRIIRKNKKRKQVIKGTISLLSCAFIAGGAYFAMGRLPEPAFPEYSETLTEGVLDNVTNERDTEVNTEIWTEDDFINTEGSSSNNKLIYMSVVLSSDSSLSSSDGEISIDNEKMIDELLSFISKYEESFLYSINYGDWVRRVQNSDESGEEMTTTYYETVEESTAEIATETVTETVTELETDEITYTDVVTDDDIPEAATEICSEEATNDNTDAPVKDSWGNLSDLVEDTDRVYIITVVDKNGKVLRYALDALTQDELAGMLEDLLTQ